MSPEIIRSDQNNVNDRRVSALILGIGMAASIAAGCSTETRHHNKNASNQKVEQMCDAISFSDTIGSDASHYRPDAFLPETDKTNSHDAVLPYINSIFKDGPVAATTNQDTLAALMAVVGTPAQIGQGQDHNIDYSYQTEFHKKVSTYKAPNGVQVAKQDCATLYTTLSEVADYSDNWVQNGEKVTGFFDKRNTEKNANNYKITDEVIPTEKVADHQYKGIQLKLSRQTKGLKGFTEVLISTDSEHKDDGDIYIKGAIKIDTPKDNAKNQNPQGKTPSTEQQPSGNAPSPENNPQPQDNGSNASGPNNIGQSPNQGTNDHTPNGSGNNGGSIGNTIGGPGPSGNGGGTPNTQPAPGNGGGTPNTQPAPGNGGGTTPNTQPSPNTTSPPETSPPTTSSPNTTSPPTTSSPNTTSPPPTTSSPTTQAPYKPPTSCDPNVAQC
ncbi:MAG: hypothetical protein NVSMB46_04300 [Candidatus Saccharimonadales bacterium]